MVPFVSLLRHTDGRSGHSYLVASRTDRAGHAVMVFIHGAAGYASYLGDAMCYFAERGFECLAPDIMGHGERAGVDIRRASVEDDYVPDMCDFIVRIVRARYPGKKIVLVGHSMGGLIVQKLAEEGIGDALILITPAPPSGVLYIPGKLLLPALSDIKGTLRLLITRAPFSPSRKLVTKFFADPVASAEIIDEWCAMRTSGESFVALHEMGLTMIGVDKARVRAPMLVIGAAKDVIIHRSVAGNVARYYGADHK